MGERTRPWPAGTPNWVDLSVDDPVAAMTSYAELFGWTCVRRGTDEYWLSSVDGRNVGGIGAKRTRDAPSRWTTYLATDQVERTLDAVIAHGGRVVSEPREVHEHGRLATAADPGGAVFGLWQAGEHIGTDRRTDPGWLVWIAALSADCEAAKAF